MKKNKSAALPVAHRKVRERILASTQADQPPFLPVHNPAFEKCSQAIAQLRTFTDCRSRPIALPSTMLPPI